MKLNLNLIASLDLNSNVLELHGQKNILDDTIEMQSGKFSLSIFYKWVVRKGKKMNEEVWVNRLKTYEIYYPTWNLSRLWSK